MQKTALNRECLPCRPGGIYLDFSSIPDSNVFAKKIYPQHRVILKNVSFGIFRIILVSKGEKKFHYRKQRQRAISEQVSMIFGRCQNHQN